MLDKGHSIKLKPIKSRHCINQLKRLKVGAINFKFMPEICLTGQIADLFRLQQEENKRDFIPINDFTSQHSVFNGFLASRLFGSILADLKTSSCRTALSNPSVWEYFFKELRGRVFQDLAFYKLSKQQPVNQTVLSPKHTLTIFHTLYPDIPKKKHRLGLDTLRSVPPHDALIIRDMAGIPITIGACEMTLHDDLGNYRRKYSWYKRHKSRSPDLRYAKCLFIVPQGTKSTPKEKPTLQIISVDFDRMRFNSLMGEVLQISGDASLVKAHLLHTLRNRVLPG
ncbi:hypothetical protein A3H85_01355 [Candidatus Daviesbacteria bacterium RIFCSPLOWO2_02_FULL_40_8]|nr:MAG: hypothetical protein A3H85_01355 [Candidatus Daviesbacteria bacterium RIFCSPLOWO2_02_FULL_40_8]